MLVLAVLEFGAQVSGPYSDTEHESPWNLTTCWRHRQCCIATAAHICVIHKVSYSSLYSFWAAHVNKGAYSQQVFAGASVKQTSYVLYVL
jgi:hypothetical protein